MEETAVEWETRYQANLVVTQTQLAHETGCAQCTKYAQPSPGKERSGSPCQVGYAYWQVHYRAGMPRPVHE